MISLIRRIKNKRRHKKFEQKCPNVRCDCCNYHYYNKNNRGCCELKNALGLSQLYGRITVVNNK